MLQLMMQQETGVVILSATFETLDHSTLSVVFTHGLMLGALLVHFLPRDEAEWMSSSNLFHTLGT